MKMSVSSYSLHSDAHLGQVSCLRHSFTGKSAVSVSQLSHIFNRISVVVTSLMQQCVSSVRGSGD